MIRTSYTHARICLLIILASLMSVHCYAQDKENQYMIVIEKLKHDKLELIKLKNGDNVRIIPDVFTNGIIVLFSDKSIPDTVACPNTLQSFEDSITITEIDTGGSSERRYELKGFPKDLSGSVILEIWNSNGEDESKYYITLLIDSSEILPDIGSSEILSKPKKNMGRPSMQNMFLEKPINFIDKKAVYILDFSPQFSEQQIYKINLQKRYDSLRIIKLVELLDEVPADSCLEIQPIIRNRAILVAGNSMQLKIHNVNTFRYNVAVDDSIIDYVSEPPYLFSQLFLGDSSGLLGSLLKGSKISKEIVSQSASAKADLFQKQEKLLVQLVDSVEGYYNNYFSIQNRVINSINRIQHLPFEPELQNQYINMAKSLLNILSIFAELSIVQSQMKISIAENKTEIEALKAKIEDSKDSKDSKESVKSIEYQIELLEQALTLFSSYDSLQKNLPSELEIRKLIQYVNGMTQHSQMYIKSIPLVSGSELEFKIDIEAKDSVMKVDPSAASEKYEIMLSLPIIKYWYMSFSSGTFVGLGSELESEIFDWEIETVVINGESVVDSTDAEYKIVSSGTNPRPAGFNALANYQYRVSPKFGLGPSVGVGLTIEEKPRISYMGGLSFSIGSRRQFLLSGGALYAPVRQLKNNLSTEYTYTATQPIEYYNKYEVAWFLSLTFTPFRSK